MPNSLSPENAPGNPGKASGSSNILPVCLLWGGPLLLLFALYYWFRPALAASFHLRLSLAQFLYGLISVELCVAIYLYGVGRLSPHWRPEPPVRPSLRSMWLRREPAGKNVSHPLGPRMVEPVKPSPGKENVTAAIGAQITVSGQEPNTGPKP